MQQLSKYAFIFLMIFSFIFSCQPKQKNEQAKAFEKGTFGYDAEFLSKHQETILLKNANAMLAVCPGYQGRVMTSTSGGEQDLSYGWLNYDLIESGEMLKHINPVGGEDRFWLGPEGGQFSVFFKAGDQFNLDDWQTPAAIDTEAFDVVSKSEQSVSFAKEFQIENYSGTSLKLKVERNISLLAASKLQEILETEFSNNLKMVAYQSSNTITNTGEIPWTKESGALSIWILGMFNPSPSMTIVIPFKKGTVADLGQKVNDTYFGKVPADRLIVRDDILYFKGDGQYRSKIGLNPKRALPLMGSYDDEAKVLTIVHYSKPEGVSDYVNSMWELQEEPFSGDAANSYNDGPVDGKAMGPFYELESSSPAAFLASNESMTHLHTTVHIQGEEAELDVIVKKLFNTNISTIKNIFQ